MITVIYHPPGMKVRIAIPEHQDAFAVLACAERHLGLKDGADLRWDALQKRLRAEAKRK